VKALLLALLRAYRYLLSRVWIGGSCRYWPTCSEYSREAIETHGAARGTYLTLAGWRAAPLWCRGVDPVPAQFRWRCWCAALRPDGSGRACRQQAGPANLDLRT